MMKIKMLRDEISSERRIHAIVCNSKRKQKSRINDKIAIIRADIQWAFELSLTDQRTFFYAAKLRTCG
jgi:hypothetical protein